uniref:sodium:solute symporter family protein n=1 Tax=Rickettsia endosymbiont of Ixodes pacificus TaxID=1133329 RepID=UPI00067A6589|nr:sodium:solute symporter family protein [Rickettsia endosymbiont of Ixodes pacificus]AKS10340.1 sodium/panthothenate symporter [Rickettsia endosymbiont of Ixodes pacificus]
MNIDIIILITFFLANLIVGIFSGRIKTVKEYAVGKQDFRTSDLVATIVATWVGGGMFSNILQKTYTDGFKFLIADITNCLSFILCYMLVPRMGEFIGTTSIAMAMGNIYGKYVKFITAISGLVVSVGFIGIQLKVFGGLIEHFFDVSIVYAILISGTIIVLYSCFGGIRAVTFTDILQFFTFCAFIPILGFVIWKHCTQDIVDVFQNSPLLNYKDIFNNTQEFFIFITLSLYFALPAFYPAYFQRFAIAKNAFQLRKAFLIATLIVLLMKIFIAVISILLYSINPTLQPNLMLGYIIDNYSYPGLKGIIISGLAALIMSTADSHINAASILVASDIMNNNSNSNNLFVCRMASIIIGVLGIFLAISQNNILDIMLMSASFYMPIVTVPFIFTVIGFRSSGKAVLIGMMAGFSTVVIWRIFFMNTGIDSVVPGIIANLLFLFGSHYLLRQPGGWGIIKDFYTLKAIQHERKRKIINIYHSFTKFNLSTFLEKNTPKNNITYSFFGIFTLFSTIATIYTVKISVLALEEKPLTILFQIMLIIATLFICYPMWPVRLSNKLKQILWIISVFFLLALCNSFFVIINNFTISQLIIFSLNTVVLAMLIRWKVVIITLIIGTFCSIQIYKYFILPTLQINITISYFYITYICLLISTIIVAFIIPSEKEKELVLFFLNQLTHQNEERKKTLLKVLQYRTEFFDNIDQNCINLFQNLNQEIQLLDKDIQQCKEPEQILQKNQKLSSIVSKMSEGGEYLSKVIFQLQHNLKINLKEVNLHDFLQKIVDQQKPLLFNKKVLFQFDNVESIYLDVILITQVIEFFIQTGITYSTQDVILIKVNNREIHYDLSFTNKMKATRDAVEITVIFNDVKVTPQIVSTLLLILNDINSDFYQIIFAHFGKSNLQITKKNELCYSLIIPKKLNNIRSAKLDLLSDDWTKIMTMYSELKETSNQIKINIAKKLLEHGIDHYIIAKSTNLSIEEVNKLTT